MAVTGLGLLCAQGLNVSEAWPQMREGRPGISRLEAVDPALLRFSQAAEVRSFDPAAHFDPGRLGLLDRFAQFAVVAAREAVKDAGADFCGALRDSTAIVTGCCLGGQTSEDAEFETLYRQGKNRVHPLTIPRTMANAGASMLSMEFGIRGPAFTVSSACSSSAHAIGLAFQMVRSGAAPLALAGGSEAPFSLGLLKAWEAMRVISPDTCRPFSLGRSGMVLGEGAAILVLEPLEAARARGARVHGEIIGFGMSSDAHHITQPSADGAALAISAALRDAGLSPEAVGYINAHGTGTPGNDSTETRAIRQTFGAHADRLAVSSTKSMHGHALGATGAIEAVAAVLALRDGVLPPTANYTAPDPECDLDVIPNRARALRVEHALSNSFAFGGLNAVLAFRGPE
ncbi:MAG TPA: beta-ketoacyl-[acyl-carrier-protein] synthase family protein [Candidatus Binatia bacterium]|nr:beta-ketoacyl-[acyl-carrier-protein] synthase family protein [Candidatus Binatia bacterium]